jgi:hypothetical protein
MFFFFLNQGPVSKDEYIALKAKREELRGQIESMMASLRFSETRFELLEAIYDPRINIVEVHNKSMGHRYIGRFSIPDIEGKRHRFTVSIANADDFPDKNDSKLLELAKEKAIELLKRKYSHLFKKT